MELINVVCERTSFFFPRQGNSETTRGSFACINNTLRTICSLCGNSATEQNWSLCFGDFDAFKIYLNSLKSYHTWNRIYLKCRAKNFFISKCKCFSYYYYLLFGCLKFYHCQFAKLMKWWKCCWCDHVTISNIWITPGSLFWVTPPGISSFSSTGK